MAIVRFFLIFITCALMYSTNHAQDSNTVYYSLFLEKSVSFGTVDTKVDEGEFNEGSSFIIPAVELPSSPFDFSLYQGLYNALVGGRFGIDYGALDNDLIMKIFIRNLDPNVGVYQNLGQESDTLFSYFEIRIWELPDSNFYHESESYYFNEGYYARFSLPKSEALLNFIDLLGIDSDDSLAFAFLEEGAGGSDDWNGYGIETIDEDDSVKFNAIHLSRIGGGKRRIASSTVKPDSVLAINIRELGGIPSSFKLSQNFPNPFNPSTKILYSLKESGLVSLNIYSVLGNHITTLINQHQLAGNYAVDFSAKDLDKRLSSGVYFYALNQNGSTITKKMILTK